MGLVFAILGLIAAGCIVAYVVRLSLKWIVNRIREKKDSKYINKVAVAEINALINDCNNRTTVDALDKLAGQGYSHIMADVDATGNIVGNIETIKDMNETLDPEVARLLGKKGMVVVEL